jgi:sugar phosphate isomerase/epimerase
MVETQQTTPAGTFGIAYTSFPIRMRQSVQTMASRGPSIVAERFIELCYAFGGQGCQMDISQLASTEPDYLKRIRAALEEKRMFLELSVSPRVLENPDAFEQMAATAHQLSVSRLRMALLSGRRYETFAEMTKWSEFAAHWQETLKRAAPWFERHKLSVGIENHKDWLADELVEMLRRIGSSYLGACVDFGNNLALLEDSVEIAEKLAPYVITTHLKDMALAPYEQGFLLSEVPLGDGILPLARIIEILRRGRRDVHLCLEMITRDPLKVPYREDRYWVTYERRDAARIQKFESRILSQASTKPLPKVSDLSSEHMLAAEDENLRRSVAYAKKTLGL